MAISLKPVTLPPKQWVDIKFQIANDSTNDTTSELDSYYIVEKR